MFLNFIIFFLCCCLLFVCCCGRWVRKGHAPDPTRNKTRLGVTRDNFTLSRSLPTLYYFTYIFIFIFINPNKRHALFLLGQTLSLAKSTLTDISVHVVVDSNGQLAPNASSGIDPPVHESMTPVRRGSRISLLGTTMTGSSGSEGGSHKLLGVGDQCRSAADLGHGGGDQVGEYELDLNVIALELTSKGVAPGLQESLGSGVGGKQGCRSKAGERAHGQDKTLGDLGRSLDGGNNLGRKELSNLESNQVVDGDNVRNLFLGSLQEGHRNRVADSDIVDENSNRLERVDEIGKGLVVLLLISRDIESKVLGLDLVLGLNFLSKSNQLGFSAGNENNVKPLLGQLVRELFANAIRGTGDNSPGTILGSVTFELPGLASKSLATNL